MLSAAWQLRHVEVVGHTYGVAVGLEPSVVDGMELGESSPEDTAAVVRLGPLMNG